MCPDTALSEQLHASECLLTRMEMYASEIITPTFRSVCMIICMSTVVTFLVVLHIWG